MDMELGMTMKKQKFEVELVFPSKYAELTNDRLMRIIEKGMIGNEWGILVQEIK